MPLYEYECDSGHRFEKLKSMENRCNTVCPRCGKVPTLLISRLARSNFFNLRIPLTVLDGDGRVIGKRFDHRPTPYPEEYYDVKKIREEQRAIAGL